MRDIGLTADEIVQTLLGANGHRNICVLDSCGVGRIGGNLLIGGIDPVEVLILDADDPNETLTAFEANLAADDRAAIFTISYELGTKINGSFSRTMRPEPMIFLALFDRLVIHDYDSGRSLIAGRDGAGSIEELFTRRAAAETDARLHPGPAARANMTREAYLAAVEQIKELIRAGETYQTNLTQQFEVSTHSTPEDIFLRLRRDHPAAFAAFLDRGDSVVVSASPEQFLRIESSATGRRITASPIKGTRRRGRTAEEDARMRDELLASRKDRAENTMIVDLMRNDLGRVCEFGTVSVAELCRLEEHPTLFHLVSRVEGELRPDVGYADVIRATFPCGSITGAPKVRTMEIIDQLEPGPRGLSMGAIGCRIPAGWLGDTEIFETSVAIRTMVIREGTAVFNVGGGVVSDSDAASEYEESLLKAQALFRALGVSLELPVPN